MKAKEGGNKKVFAIVVRLLIIVVTALCFHGFRFFLLFAAVVLLIIDLLRTLQSRDRITLLLLDIIAVLWLVSMYWLYYPIENLRFRVLDKQYESAVEEVLPVLEEAEDTDWSTYELRTFLPLSLGNEIVYFKHGDYIAVYFSTFHSFSANAGFIRFSDKNARNYYMDTSAGGFGRSYDFVEEFTPLWAYIKLY